MYSSKERALLVIAIVSAMAMMATLSVAQAPSRSPAPGITSKAGPEDRFAIIQSLGLTDPALQLTAAQSASIDELVLAYVAEQNALVRQNSVKPDSRPSQQASGARRTAREGLRAAVARVLSGEQRQIWEAAQTARQAQMNAARSRAARPPNDW